MKLLKFLGVLALMLGGFLVVSLARLNYDLATMRAASSEGSDEVISAVMYNYGFRNMDGCETREPSDAVKIQALIISL